MWDPPRKKRKSPSSLSFISLAVAEEKARPRFHHGAAKSNTCHHLSMRLRHQTDGYWPSPSHRAATSSSTDHLPSSLFFLPHRHGGIALRSWAPWIRRIRPPLPIGCFGSRWKKMEMGKGPRRVCLRRQWRCSTSSRLGPLPWLLLTQLHTNGHHTAP